MLVGLQGVGKTTTAGKIAQKLASKKPLLVACDVYRPAAVEQLKVIAEAIQIPLFFKDNLTPLEICVEAKQHAMAHGHEVMIIDTAGRLSIDDEMMAEISAIKEKMSPEHTLLVVDAMMGQDAVTTAVNFQKSVDFDAMVMTKIDGDARGGAALSICHVTGKPIALIGKGEGYGDLEDFHPEGFSSRILGLGDVISLMADFKKLEEAEQSSFTDSKNLMGMTFQTYQKQLRLIKKMGPLKQIIGKLPQEFSKYIPMSGLGEVSKFLYVIDSMTDLEKKCLVPLSESRCSRIAKGSGTPVPVVTQFVSGFYRMKSMMHSFANDKGLDSNQAKQLKGLSLKNNPLIPKGLADMVEKLTHTEQGSVDQENGENKRVFSQQKTQQLKMHRKLVKNKRKSSQKSRRK